MDKVRTTKSMVAVFGATGHTGRSVIAELMRRGVTPVAIARDAAALAEATFPDPDVLRRHATIGDATSLDRALHGAQAVINCAGLSSTRPTLSRAQPCDLMAMIALDSWHPTRGTRITVDRKAVGNLAITGGRLAPAPTPPAQKRWNFGDPLGDQAVIEVPFSEAILISRHMKTGELHNYLSQLAVDDVLDPATPTPKATDETGRSNQHFVVDVVVTRGDERRRATVRGRDIYAISAPLVCEAVERLLVGKFSATGAHAPGEIFDAGDILAALGPDNSTFEVFAA